MFLCIQVSNSVYAVLTELLFCSTLILYQRYEIPTFLGCFTFLPEDTCRTLLPGNDRPLPSMSDATQQQEWVRKSDDREGEGTVMV